MTVDVIYSPRWICDPPSASSAPSLPLVNSSAPCCLSLCPPPSGGGRLGCRYLHWHGTETLDLWGKPAVSPQLPLEHLGALHSCNDNNNKKWVFLVSSVAHVHRSRYQDNRKHREIQPQGSYLWLEQKVKSQRGRSWIRKLCKSSNKDTLHLLSLRHTTHPCPP